MRDLPAYGAGVTPTRPRPVPRDLYAVAAAVLLVTAAVLVGRYAYTYDDLIVGSAAPARARWSPGPVPRPGAVVAAVVVAYGLGRRRPVCRGARAAAGGLGRGAGLDAGRWR
ncbi:hypothetical protein SVIOM342S_08726 [Streptomyces violaceorubidus]